MSSGTEGLEHKLKELEDKIRYYQNEIVRYGAHITDLEREKLQIHTNILKEKEKENAKRIAELKRPL